MYKGSITVHMEQPRFCTYCGETLNATSIILGDFDAFTGERKVTRFLCCPKVGLNQRNAHDYYEIKPVEFYGGKKDYDWIKLP